MTDWSVVGEIIGETNLDEVGESVERSLQDAAEAAAGASGATEDMEKSMDSATEAVASLAGASSEADDQLEEVEAEMEDIVTDAGAAAGSVSLLGSTLEGVDDMDIDIDVDDNIDDLNTKWANMRNEIDDFEHRFDDIIPRGGDGGAPIGDFLGDQREFEHAMDTLDRADESIRDIADAKRRAAESTDGDILDPFRNVNIQSREARQRVGEALRPAGRFETVNMGRLSSTLQGEGQSGDIARALMERSDVEGDFGEVLRAVNEAGDLDAARRFGEQMAEIDTTPALPAPEDTGLPRTTDIAGGRIGIAGRGMTTPAVGRGSLAGGIPAPDDVIEIPPEGTGTPADVRRGTGIAEQLSDQLGRAGEGFDNLRSLDVSGRTPQTRAQLLNMGLLEDFEEIVSPLNDTVNVTDDEFESLGRNVRSTSDDTSRLSDRFNELRDSVSDTTARVRQNVGERARGGLRGDIMDIRGGGGRDFSMPDIDADFDDLGRIAAQTDTTIGFLGASFDRMYGQANNASEAVDELDDEIMKLGQAARTASPVFENLSANLGPFNISMSNLLVTIPALIATIGPMIAVLAGLAGALVGVTAAFAGLLAIGAIGFVEELKNNFSDIESTSDALMAIMQGLKESFIDALAPLQDVTIGGLGGQGIFVTMLRDIVTLVNMFATAAAALLEMDVVEDFLLNMRAAVLGFSDATEGGMTMIEGMKEGMKGALPVLGDFLIWLIDVFPEFMAFTGHITAEMAPALSQLGQAFLRLSVLLTEAGTGALNVLLPALSLVFQVSSVLLGALIKLERELGAISSVFIGLGGAALVTMLTLSKMIGVLQASLIFALHAGIAYSRMRAALWAVNPAIVTVTRSTALMAGRFLLVASAVYMLLDVFGALEPLIEGVNEVTEIFAGSLSTLTGDMGVSEEATNTVIDAVKTLVSVFILASWAASQLFAVSMAGASVAMLKFAGSAVASAIAGLSAFATELIVSTGGLWGLISAETTATIVTQGFTGAIWSAVASLSALQVVAGVAVVAAIALLASEMLGFTNVLSDVQEAVLAAITAITVAFLGSGWGAIIVAVGLLIAALIKLRDIVGPVAASVVAAIGAITAAFLGSGWGAIIVALGLAAAAIYMLGKRFGWLKVIAIGAIGAITAALVGSGWGAIIVGLGLLLLLLIEYWDEVANAVKGVISWFDELGPAGKLAIMAVLAPLSPLLAGLLAVREAIGLILNPQKRQDWWSSIQDGLDGLMNTIKGIVDWVIKLFTDPMAAIGQLFSWIKRGIQKLLGRFGGQAGRGDEGDGVGGAAGSIGAGAVAGAAAGSVIPGAGTAGGALVGGAAGAIDHYAFDLPVLQKGGFINESGLAYLHSNEMVVPQGMVADADINTGTQSGGGRRRASSGGGGTTVNVQIDNAGGDIDDRRARQIGDIARRRMDRRRRREDGR